MGLVVFPHGMNAGADKPNPLLIPGAVIVPLEIFSIGPHIHEKDGRVSNSPPACSLAMTASLTAYMQHTEEQ